MSRRNRRDRSSQQSPAVVAPVSSTSPLQEPQHVYYVQVENLMQQPLVVSVLDEAGQPYGVRVGPRGKSRPIRVDQVGLHTQELASAGRVRIVPHS